MISPVELAERIGALQAAASVVEDASDLDMKAEQYYLLALSALEQARRFAIIADFQQSHALAAMRGYR